MNTLNKRRTSFVYHNQAYMIETILNIAGQPTFLRTEVHDDTSPLDLPDFIQVVKDVTSEKLYSSPTLAHVDFKYQHPFEEAAV